MRNNEENSSIVGRGTKNDTQLSLSRSYLISNEDNTLVNTKMRLNAVGQLFRISSRCLHNEVLKFDANLPVEKALTPPSSWFSRQDFHDLDKVIFLARKGRKSLESI